ncbi:hypothetical protein [Actinoplanes friuliensis]|jgi:hypothetical protein|uniref:Uncharacterized protein n=1 Tax=Actinoplanes friuliensis DSM 7358 TaxID=1246995 RepID=U5VYI7_9ACTN|nr:hypothetical protein [Actinoplanes friuliensis]AGZ41847.1 hypothetical protein AFR_17845 [Actinoplanes friuliensis DSM 7358]
MTESTAGSDATAGEQPEVEPTEGDQPEEEFVNRAARRAKGKKAGGGPEVFTKGQRPMGRGSVQSPRQYGNRRSG